MVQQTMMWAIRHASLPVPKVLLLLPETSLLYSCCFCGCSQCIYLHVQGCVWWQEIQQGSGSEACPEYHPWIPTYSLDTVILELEGSDLLVQAVQKLVKTAGSWWLPEISLVSFPCLWAATLQDFFPTLWHSWSTFSLPEICPRWFLVWGAMIRRKDREPRESHQKWPYSRAL